MMMGIKKKFNKIFDNFDRAFDYMYKTMEDMDELLEETERDGCVLEVNGIKTTTRIKDNIVQLYVNDEKVFEKHVKKKEEKVKPKSSAQRPNEQEISEVATQAHIDYLDKEDEYLEGVALTLDWVLGRRRSPL